jgi:CcmD family protein
MMVAALVAVPAVAMASQPQPPKEFVPVDTIPAAEQIPAINLVAAAYGFVWFAMIAYVWSLASRLKTVEAELTELESRRK